MSHGDAEGGEAEPPPLDPGGTLAELLGAPDRDRCPGARPVVSVSEEDDPAFLAEVNAHCVAAPRLERRGAFHGDWAELDDGLGFYPHDPLPVLRARWDAARPVVLHDVLSDEVMELVRTDRRLEALSGPEGLAAWAEERVAHLEPDFTVLGTGPAVSGPAAEGEIARLRMGWRGDPGPPVDDLWLKAQRLSLHPDDRSLRVRFSFGREGPDDASRDLFRHRLVAQLAERFLPELGPLHRDAELRSLLAEWVGGAPLLTQGIAYWNAPNGGALLHHDAFDEPLEGRQRGVLYAQLTGATAWLALAVDDLAVRLREFVELLDEGTFGPLADALLPPAGSPDAAALRALLADDAALVAELVLPGQGRLGALTGRGPEFTSLLADAGHGFVVSAGDVILLPNHGLGATCMHSVFCASPEPAFSLSLAIRESSPAGPARRGGKGGPRRRRGPGGGRRASGARGRGRGRPGRGPGSSRRRR